MRKHYLDNIRWMTVVAVVLYHVLYMYNAEGVLGGLGRITSLPVQYYDIYLYAVYPWLMPVLFLVSGISARYALERQSDREFFRSRTTRLLVPSTIGLFVFQFIQGYISMSLSDAFATMGQAPAAVKYIIMVLSGSGVLWYMQLLWVLSAALLLIRKIERDRLWTLCAKTPLFVIALLSLAVWAAAQILNTPVVIVYRFGYFGAMFLLGYFVISHSEVIEALKKRCGIFIAAAVVLCVAFCAVNFGENYADTPINRSILFCLYGYFGSIAILAGMARFGDFANERMEWMSRHSFGLYMFHYLGISAVALFIAKPGLVPAPVSYLLSLIAGFAAGYILYAIISRIPFFRWAVLGIKKRK